MISFLYDFIYTFPIYIVSLILMSNVLNIPERGVVFYILAILLMGLISCIKNLANSLSILITGIFSVIVAGIILVQKPDQRIVYIHEHLWVGWMLLIGVAIFILGRLIIASKWIRRLSAILLIAVATTIMLKNVQIDRIVITLIFFELLIYLIDAIQSTWEKSGETDNKKHLVFVAPWIVAIGIIVSLVKVSDKPYDWNFVRMANQRIGEIAKLTTRFMPGKSEDFAGIGFAEDTVLAGIISRQSQDLMELSAGKNSGKIIYLSGKTFDTFTGREWTNTYISDNHDRLIDAIETSCAVMAYEPDYISDYIKYSELKLKYQVFNTQYLFVPLKTNLTTEKLNDIEYEDRSDALYTSKKLGYGTEYNVRFYQLNKDSSEFANLMNESIGFSEDIWKYKCGKEVNLTYDDYLRHKSDMLAHYSEDITISNDLRDVLDTVYEGSTSDWDKMKRLEAYILSFKYTNEPGKLPDNVQDAESFLDYFMLEKKEGYCVHFASAFTMLARAEGLPARFVQGYVVKNKETEDVMVTSNMAHAWPEVYFENVGWISFDPTPGYHQNVSWKIAERGDEDADGMGYESIDYDELREKYMQQLEMDEEDTDAEAKAKDSKYKSINIAAILIPLVFALLFVIIFLCIYQFMAIKRYRMLDISDQVKVMCRLNMVILDILGYSLKEGETLEEYSKKLIEQLPEDAYTFVRYYEEILYAGMKADKDELAIVNASNKILVNLLKEQKGYRSIFYSVKIGIKFAGLRKDI